MKDRGKHSTVKSVGAAKNPSPSDLFGPQVIDAECGRCSRRYVLSDDLQACSCGGQLLLNYDLAHSTGGLLRNALRDRAWNMWRYRELLPLGLEHDPVSLGEGGTPLVSAPHLAKAIGIKSLLIKDEGQNPTGSFKARGASMAFSFLRDRDVRRVGVLTAGNTGAAWSAYAARVGLPITVVMAAPAPDSAVRDCAASGADVVIVQGTEADAASMLAKAVYEHGWFNASRGPYRIEGKKTVAFELAEQLNWRMPDAIVYPTGPGNGLLALWKGLTELVSIGLLSHLPMLVAVQSAACSPYVSALREGETSCRPHAAASSIAPGIIIEERPSIDTAVLAALRSTGGTAIGVEDASILAWMYQAAQGDGILAAPEGAAGFAAAAQLRESGVFDENTRVACIVTASLMRYRHLIEPRPRVLSAGDELAV